MTAIEIIEAIKRLPREEQIKVADLVCQVVEHRRLSPEELGSLAQRMVDEKDPAEADRMQEAIIRGFYGGQAHA